VLLGNLKRHGFCSVDMRRALLDFARDTGQFVERESADLERLIAWRADPDYRPRHRIE
jgi:hypothetical protein